VGSDLVSRILTGNKFQTHVKRGAGLKAGKNWMRALQPWSPNSTDKYTRQTHQLTLPKH